MLKRPLQHADDISGFDFALRPYCVVSADGEVVKVQRQPSPDIMVMELVSATTVTAEKLIRGLKQWSVQPDAIMDTGLPRAQSQVTGHRFVRISRSFQIGLDLDPYLALSG